MTRVIAIDWSGASVGAEKRIWRADVVDGELVYLRNGFCADHVASQLIALAGDEPELGVGLDFAFSMPAWFLAQAGIASAPELWRRVAESLGERWLAGQAWPFWGRAGSKKPLDCELYRRTEIDVQEATGFLPKSVFQCGGAGAVGTASLRGMRVLHRLCEGGFCVWPFDEPSLPAVVEIYPRVLTGRVRKSDAGARAAYVTSRPDVPRSMRDVMIRNEDAFDAAISALEMWRHRADFIQLLDARDDVERLEGAIWLPAHGAISGRAASP